MNFAVFECTKTMELHQQARRAGFSAWIPVELRYAILDDGKREVRRSCAMPGYIFVVFEQWLSFRIWASERYAPRVMLMHYGQSGVPEAIWRTLVRPIKVPLSDLQDMDTALREAWENEKARYRAGEETTQEDNQVFSPNDRVTVVLGVFKGQTGTVASIKPNHIRVQLGTQFVKMPKAFLQLV